MFTYCENNAIKNVDTNGNIAANVIGSVIGGIVGVVGGIFLTNWLADKLKLSGWKRNVFVWGLTAVIGAAAAVIGYFIGPYIAKAWSSLCGKLTALVKQSFHKIGQISAKKMSHINVSKHLWSRVMKKVTTKEIQSIIKAGVHKGKWELLKNGSVKITYKYKGQIIVITGKVIDKVFKIGDAWVQR